ncbi:hypothetical protein UFOVP827_67, partial [uncultured Caudovirales phage]
FPPFLLQMEIIKGIITAYLVGMAVGLFLKKEK